VGNPTAIDVSVANTLSAHHQDSQEKEIKKREKKHTKYMYYLYDLGRAEDAVIVPAVVTSYGALHHGLPLCDVQMAEHPGHHIQADVGPG
jgi:hypothetical protein